MVSSVLPPLNYFSYHSMFGNNRQIIMSYPLRAFAFDAHFQSLKVRYHSLCWQDALEVMSIIAVMVNCALIGMSDLADRLFPQYTAAERIVLIVILEVRIYRIYYESMEYFM